MPMDINSQVQRAFESLESFYSSDFPSLEMKAKLLSALGIALNELNITSLELQQQNEELEASRHLLEEERQRYQQLYDFAPDAYLVTNDDGVIIEANLAAAQLFRMNRSFLIGTPLIMFVSSEDRIKFRTRLAEKKNSTVIQSENWEFNISSGNRTPFPVSAMVAKVISASGTTSGFHWLVHDITEQKQTEADLQKYNKQELSRSEERFARVFQASPVMMAITNKNDGRYIDVNNAWLKAFGFTRREVIGRNARDIKIWDKTENINEKHVDLLENREVQDCELIFGNGAGEVRICLANTEIILIDEQEYLLLTMVDITNQKLMEREIAQLDRLNLIGEMAASIGHEIRNPMTSVRGFLQILGSKAEYQDDLTYFELMIEELDRANDIITEYLSMAKNKPVELKLQSLDIVLKALYPMIQSDANHREITVKLDLNCPAQVLIDTNEIRQLIINITRNGLEAMTQGGDLTIGTMQESDKIVLFIKDEGPGIPPDISNKLDLPFFTTKENGTGLGLPICYSIAARHNAKLDYETGSSGTTFYLRFPLPGE